jgi:hypothetical protein
LLSKNKLLFLKWDTLQKHAGRRKVDKDIKDVCRKGEYYWSATYAHQRNATLYATQGHRSVISLKKNRNFKGERARKKV